MTSNAMTSSELPANDFMKYIYFTGFNLNSGAWLQHLRAHVPSHIQLVTDAEIDLILGTEPEKITYAAVWKPEPGRLARLTGLEAIFGLSAGVDALLADPTLPRVPLIRSLAHSLGDRMAEFALLNCLMILRQRNHYRRAQALSEWSPRLQPSAGDVTVGIMGYGQLGRCCAKSLLGAGFKVRAYKRSALGDGARDQASEMVEIFHGESQLKGFAGGTDILLCLLPATKDTQAIINFSLLEALSRNGPFGAPAVINAARGNCLNEADLLRALDADLVSEAVLDVFAHEPLPSSSPLWLHPRVTVTPHVAADSDPEELSKELASNIEDFEAGREISGLVDREQGY